MKRVRIKISYDGTDFSGFQQQPGQRTVEGELNRALSLLTGENIEIIGASRTDSGVHALGNIAVFDTESPVPAEKFALAALRFLPPDLRIVSGDEVPMDWHPRKQDCVKTYEYLADIGEYENPLMRLYTSYEGRRLDIEAMRRGAAYLKGEHDFTSFANPSSQVLLNGGSAVRTIYSLDITEQAMVTGSLVIIKVSGSGFLYNMVRIVAGTLINVGKGFIKPETVGEMLEARDRTKAGPTAEAKGLRLVNIEYRTPIS